MLYSLESSVQDLHCDILFIAILDLVTKGEGVEDRLNSVKWPVEYP